MRKLILALGTLALFAGGAFAATAEGVIKEFNKDTRVIMLEDGKSYTVPADVALPADLAVGQKITITVGDDDATKVEAVMTSAM